MIFSSVNTFWPAKKVQKLKILTKIVDWSPLRRFESIHPMYNIAYIPHAVLYVVYLWSSTKILAMVWKNGLENDFIATKLSTAKGYKTSLLAVYCTKLEKFRILIYFRKLGNKIPTLRCRTEICRYMSYISLTCGYI